MRRLTSLIAVLSVAAVSFAVACRSDDNNTTVDGHTGSNGSGSNSTTTVKDVQSDSMAPGTAVTLNGVVVTAIDTFGDKTGDMWVEDMGGGKRSGVHVFKASASGVAVGDVVNVTDCIKSEFALTGSNADNTGRTTTELEPPMSGATVTVTKTGATATITPDKVDALAIGKLYDSTMVATGGGSAFSNAWEDWEGVLVELDNVSAAGKPAGFGMTPFSVDAYAFNITGVAKVEGTMTDITTSSIALGTCFGKITGVVDYFYNYQILPRTSADFNTAGTACPAPEAAAGAAPGTCTDTIDNDGNGFSDCNDLGCSTGSNAWLGATCTASDATCGCSKNLTSGTSVHTVNTTLATASSPVILRDVYVTAVNGSFSYWVSDTLTAAPSNGILVFSSPPVGLTVGQKIANLQGIAGPFGSTLKTIEVSNATASTPGVGGAVIPLTGIATDTLTSATLGAPYMGSLVTLTKAKVTKIANMFGEIELTDTAGKKIFMDDDAFRFYGGTSSAPLAPVALNDCIVVTGVMDANTNDLIRTINPRGTGDIVTATGCL